MSINSAINIHNLVMCANIFVRKDDKYLMIKRSENKKISPGFLHTIGGKIDDNEQPYRAALRELDEEAGLKVENIKLECVVLEVISADNPIYHNNWLVYYFSGDYKSGQVKNTEEGDLMWLSLDEIRAGKLIPAVRETFELQLDSSRGVVFAKFIYDKDMNILSKEIDECAM